MFIVRVTVEHNKDGRDDIYHVGPFASEQAARDYAEAFHGDLDLTEVLPLSAGPSE